MSIARSITPYLLLGTSNPWDRRSRRSSKSWTGSCRCRPLRWVKTVSLPEVPQNATETTRYCSGLYRDWRAKITMIISRYVDYMFYYQFYQYIFVINFFSHHTMTVWDNFVPCRSIWTWACRSIWTWAWDNFFSLETNAPNTPLNWYHAPSHIKTKSTFDLL